MTKEVKHADLSFFLHNFLTHSEICVKIHLGEIIMFKRIVCILLSALVLFSSFSFAFAAEDSTGESEKKNFILGDADKNGKVNASDARLTLRYSAKLITAKKIDLNAADFDRDGKIQACDARYILRTAARLDPYITEKNLIDPLINKNEVKIINVKTLCQYPNFPSGCEIVSAVMNLNYYGLNITVNQFIQKYLPLGTSPYYDGTRYYGSDPDVCFLGNPRSTHGWGIWAKGLTKSIQKYLDACKNPCTVKYTYSESLNSLCKKYVRNNVPVLVWVTQSMATPYENVRVRVEGSTKSYTWISPNHCMLLVGYDKDYFYFNDPITGKREKYSRTRSNIAFEGNGCQAVVIEKKIR